MQTVGEIKKHLRRGDYTRLGKMVGISGNYAEQLLKRPTAKRHKEVVAKARKIAQANQKLGL